MDNINNIHDKGVILVTGGVKSGKSLWAEKLISKKNNITYVATNTIKDTSKEWIEKIEKHKKVIFYSLHKLNY